MRLEQILPEVRQPPGGFSGTPQQDFTAFYLEEIKFRTLLMLPPFRRMAKHTTADPISDRAEYDGRELVRALEIHKRDLALVATELIGPVPPFFHRIGGRYRGNCRWQIIIRSPDPNQLLKDFSIPRDWILELDPVSTL